MQHKSWMLWVGSTAVGLGVGGGLAEFVSSMIEGHSGLNNALFSPRWQISVGFSFGAPALLAQYLVLRQFVPEAIRWIIPATIGLVIGVVGGALVGLAIVIWILLLATGSQSPAPDFVLAGVMLLLFLAAGGDGGAVIGGLMGILLRFNDREWLQDWTWPLMRAWAGSGATFAGLVLLLLADQPLNRSGLLDTAADVTSISLAGIAGVAAGLVGGALSGRQFVLAVGRQRPTG